MSPHFVILEVTYSDHTMLYGPFTDEIEAEQYALNNDLGMYKTLWVNDVFGET